MLPGFSFRLKELRIAANFTQEEVASKVKVSRSVISAYETDTRWIDDVPLNLDAPLSYGAFVNLISKVCKI